HERPPWAHPHGPAIKASHNNCSTVRQWQQRMAATGRQITIDGDYGPVSEEVCRAFQQEKGLEVDGEVGPMTWAKSWE
ncbi:MAG: peptidoglycan-binding protein, partial [Actinobacteria bacterium]|nr:peptidoglycan-binding protein [Actinomycetota bacterium]